VVGLVDAEDPAAAVVELHDDGVQALVGGARDAALALGVVVAAAALGDALEDALEEIEREENGQKFLKMLASIKPVKSEYSSEQMVRMLREGKEQELLDNKMKHAK
jgi:hypothetical protein